MAYRTGYTISTLDKLGTAFVLTWLFTIRAKKRNSGNTPDDGLLHGSFSLLAT